MTVVGSFREEGRTMETTVEEKASKKVSPQVLKKAFVTAFPFTIPIFAGFWFLGMTYGIYMNVSGFSFWYPMLMSLTIFAGSVEFVAVNLLLGRSIRCRR